MTELIDAPKHVPPLNHCEFHILLALADRQRHGYGIMQEVAARSGGTVRLGPGTLYGAIKRMLAAGLIEVSATRPVADNDDQRRRCYYRLTEFGRTVAAKEAQRLAALVHVAEAKRLVPINVPSVAGGA
jgi:DNA-binding PadR family transcriptional regulator